ncbi:MAG: putative colanic acid biosynthesis acetyltransferase [Steroidobacteraceae bacterium]
MAKRRVIDLSRADRGDYVPARGFFVRLAWLVVEALLVNNRLLVISSWRIGLLRLFGAKIGTGCRFMQAIRVKFPWELEVGDHCWFGEGVWIWNHARVQVGSHVCLSQNAFLSSGSHGVSTDMVLRVAPIVIEDGVWVSTGCVVQMGVTIGRSAVVTPLSVVHKSLEAEGIYGGNPCRFIKWRFEKPAD